MFDTIRSRLQELLISTSSEQTDSGEKVTASSSATGTIPDVDVDVDVEVEVEVAGVRERIKVPGGYLPPAEGKVDYPLTLPSPYGSMVLDKRPERVVAAVPMGYDTELMLALGVRPTLSSSSVCDRPYLKPYDVADIPTWETDYGTENPHPCIAASNPDLIVALGWTEEDFLPTLLDHYGQLTSIAPVLTDKSMEGLKPPWQESLKTLARVLDLEGRADKVISQYEQYFTQLRQAHPEFQGLTATWACLFGGDLGLGYFSYRGSQAAKLLENLGFKPNSLLDNFPHLGGLSAEAFRLMNTEVLIMSYLKRSEFHKLTELTLFKHLEAVKSGHMVSLDGEEEVLGEVGWAMELGSPISTAWAAGVLAELIGKTF